VRYILTELDAFFTDHHHCGDLDAGVEWPIVWSVPVWGQQGAAGGEGEALASAC
jgi:hypothetical protein